MLIDRLAAEEPRLKVGSPSTYVIAAALATLSLLLRFILGNTLSGVPFLTFFPAVLISALIGGVGPGMLATVLSGLLAWFFLIPPLWSLKIDTSSDVLGLMLFFAISAVDCLVIQAFLSAVTRLRRERRTIAELNRTLEDRVAIRTRELGELNASLVAANSRLEAEIHAREKAEEIVRQTHKMEALGQLTSGVAHDFNNLLTVIRGNLELLQDGVSDSHRQLLANAMHGADRAATLTHGLLAFSRQQALQPRTVDCNQLVTRLSDVIGQTLGPGISIERIQAAGLWKCLCDPTQLETALLNLIVNARDAMPGGGKLTIEAANTELDDRYAAAHSEVVAGQYVMIAVTDTGAGMNKETIARAFDPFFTTKPDGKGTGLGLSMVFGFAKQSGGHVKIYSEPGSGTTVRLYLPRQLASEEVLLAQPTEPARRGSGTVLLVEDDGDVRTFTTAALGRLGYRVIEAEDGPQALELIRKGTAFDILLTDVSMPLMDGRTLAAEVAALRPNVPVLFTTGYTRNAIVHNGRLDPGVVLLVKPFTVAQLESKLREAVDLNNRTIKSPD